MKPEEDNKIYELLQQGNSINSICKELEVSKDKVRRVRDTATEYCNLQDGNVLYIGKKPKFNEGIFHVLYKYVSISELCTKSQYVNRGEGIPLVYQKSLLKRLSDYCNLTYDRVQKLRKEVPYVPVEILDCKDIILQMYEESFEEQFKEKYYYKGDMGFVKGFKLYYLRYDLNREFSYYVNLKVISLIGGSTTPERVLKTNKTKDYMNYLASKIAVELHKWCKKKIREGYKEDEVIRCLRANEKYSKIDYGGNLEIPPAIYYDTRGFSELPEELKYSLIEDLKDEYILGSFDYDIMEWEVKKLEYKLKNTS